MKLPSETRIDEIYKAICDIFRKYNVSEQDVIEINKKAGIDYILSLKKRFNGTETKSTMKNNDTK